MFILKKAVVNKFKSYSNEQVVLIEDDVTTLVGKNESGKTAFLEALAKLNYFNDDDDFKFDVVQDYPRNELKKYQRGDEVIEPIICTFELDDKTIREINDDLGDKVLTTNTFTVGSRYEKGRVWYHLNSDEKKYIENLQNRLNFDDETKATLLKLGSIKSILNVELDDNNAEIRSVVLHLKENIVSEGFDWDEKN